MRKDAKTVAVPELVDEAAASSASVVGGAVGACRRSIAVAGGGRSWRCALGGLGGIVLVQTMFGVPVGSVAL